MKNARWHRISPRLRDAARAALLLGGLAALLLLLTWTYPALHPSEAWNDHVFYWGQANEWLRLGQPLLLDPSVAALLEEYRTSYYYREANGVALQPPYVYRPLVPVIAGSIGTVIPLGSSFFLITLLSFMGLGFASYSSTKFLTRSRTAGTIALILSVSFPPLTTYLRFPAMVDLPSLAVVAAAFALGLHHWYKTAFVIAALVAPLIKETLLPLAACIVVLALIRGESRKWMWVAALAPPLIQVGLRVLIQVPDPPHLSEIFVLGHPLDPLHSYVDAFWLAGPLTIGLLVRKVRWASLASIPLVGLLSLIALSTVSSAERIWLTAWPLILTIGLAGLWLWLKTRFNRAVLVGAILLSYLIGHLMLLDWSYRQLYVPISVVTLLWLWTLALVRALPPDVSQRTLGSGSDR